VPYVNDLSVPYSVLDSVDKHFMINVVIKVESIEARNLRNWRSITISYNRVSISSTCVPIALNWRGSVSFVRSKHRSNPNLLRVHVHSIR
jgi:hypothetical protein